MERSRRRLGEREREIKLWHCCKTEDHVISFKLVMTMMIGNNDDGSDDDEIKNI